MTYEKRNDSEPEVGDEEGEGWNVEGQAIITCKNKLEGLDWNMCFLCHHVAEVFDCCVQIGNGEGEMIARRAHADVEWLIWAHPCIENKRRGSKQMELGTIVAELTYILETRVGH